MPQPEIDPLKIKMIMISEAPPRDHSDYFYKNAKGSFFETTKIAFHDAGVHINSYDDITNLGIYLSTAIKCSKKDYLVLTDTIKECSLILEKELDQFPNIKVIMCMGDFAIKAINYIYKRKYGKTAMKPGSTYKIRKEKHIHDKIRFFPSYTQTGDSFNIEKSKRKMIAEDLKKAISLIQD
jgi:uracil-DNA glycosylase